MGMAELPVENTWVFTSCSRNHGRDGGSGTGLLAAISILGATGGSSRRSLRFYFGRRDAKNFRSAAFPACAITRGGGISSPAQVHGFTGRRGFDQSNEMVVVSRRRQHRQVQTLRPRRTQTGRDLAVPW